MGLHELYFVLLKCIQQYLEGAIADIDTFISYGNNSVI